MGNELGNLFRKLAGFSTAALRCRMATLVSRIGRLDIGDEPPLETAPQALFT